MQAYNLLTCNRPDPKDNFLPIKKYDILTHFDATKSKVSASYLPRNCLPTDGSPVFYKCSFMDMKDRTSHNLHSLSKYTQQVMQDSLWAAYIFWFTEKKTIKCRISQKTKTLIGKISRTKSFFFTYSHQISVKTFLKLKSFSKIHIIS